MKPKKEQPWPVQLAGPDQWKDGPHLTVRWMWSCGSDSQCRRGKARAYISRKQLTAKVHRISP